MKVYFDEENNAVINVEQVQYVKPTILDYGIEIQCVNAEPIVLYYKKTAARDNAIEKLYALMVAVERGENSKS